MLKRPHFRRIWSAMTVSSLGDWLGVFALTTFVQRLSGNSEFAVGGVLLFRVLPALLFAQVAGVLADRFDRRRLMITADISRAVLIMTVPFIHQLWVLFAVSAVMEMLSLMWTPAKDATIPNLVDRKDLLVANQLSLITTYGTFPISGALLALLAALAGALSGTFTVLKDQPSALAFFIDGGTFLFSAAMVATLPRHAMRAKRARGEKFSFLHAFRDLAEGWRFVRGSRTVQTLVLSAWIAFTGGSAVISLGPFYAAATRGGSASGAAAAWGTLIVAVGTGLVGGMIVAGALAKKVARERIFPAGLALSGIGVILVASMRSISPAIVFVFFTGLGAGVAWVTVFTLLQERVDDRLRGRTFATLYSGVHLSLFIGLAGWPFLARAVGNHTIGGYELEGFRSMLFGGGAFLAASGVIAARRMRDAVKRGASARLRGLQFKPRPIAGGARRGLFIAFEGVEGAGKSTQMFSLQTFLREFGKEVVMTREPGGTAIGERIRNVLLDPASKEMDAKTEALLYAAARSQHVAQVIRPALESGAAVLCDRYLDSSVAYQGLARGLGDTDVYQLNVWATDELIPDLVILLDLDPEVGLSRAGGPSDRIENEDISFHRKVAEAFRQLAKENPSRFVVVDASQPVDAVAQAVQKAVYNLLNE